MALSVLAGINCWRPSKSRTASGRNYLSLMTVQACPSLGRL
jgi:hypothetical protein